MHDSSLNAFVSCCRWDKYVAPPQNPRAGPRVSFVNVHCLVVGCTWQVQSLAVRGHAPWNNYYAGTVDTNLTTKALGEWCCSSFGHPLRIAFHESVRESGTGYKKNVAEYMLCIPLPFFLSTV